MLVAGGRDGSACGDFRFTVDTPGVTGVTVGSAVGIPLVSYLGMFMSAWGRFQHRNALVFCCAANSTGADLHAKRGCGGFPDDLPVTIAMFAGSRQDGAGRNAFSAIQTVGIAGVACGIAGGIGGILYLRVGMRAGLLGSHAGGSYHILRDLPAKQQPGIFRIIYKHVTHAGNGLNRIVSAHFPGIHRIFFHPFQQDVQALYNAGSAPHGARYTPAHIHIQHHSGTVAPDGFTGIVVAAAFAVGRVAPGGVFAGIGGPQMHDIADLLAGAQLAFGPDVLLIPGGAAVPLAGNGDLAVEQGHLVDIACLTVGVFVVVTDIFVAVIVSIKSVGGGHQILQLSIKLASRRIAGGGAAGQNAHGIPGVVAGVVILGIGG